MKSYKLPLLLIVLVSLALYCVPCRVEGSAIKKSSSRTSIVSQKGKTLSDPSEAAAAGFKIGQTVLVKKGIIYKLAQDSKTGRYFYKRYRAVKKKKRVAQKKTPAPAPNKIFADPSDAAAAGFQVGQTVVIKKGIIYKLARESRTGKYIYKRYRAARKKKKPEPSKTVQADVAAKVYDGSDSHPKEKVNVKPQEKTAEKPLETSVKSRSEQRRHPANVEAKGRNMKRLKASATLSHAFLDRKTVITDQSLTDAGGTTQVTTGVGLKDTFSTDMHNDSVRVRLGLTDTVEVFLDAGVAFDTLSALSDMEPAFGGGFRVNIATVDDGFFSGGYLAFSGEYLQGKLTTKDTSADGLVESFTSTDWQDMTATLETGIILSKVSLYTGFSYMLYSESVTTKQIESPSGDIRLIEEELEQQDSFNFLCGVEYHVSPSLDVQFEVQAPNRQGGIMSVEYRF